MNEWKKDMWTQTFQTTAIRLLWQIGKKLDKYTPRQYLHTVAD